MDKPWNDLELSWNGLELSWNNLELSWTLPPQKKHRNSALKVFHISINALFEMASELHVRAGSNT